MLRHLRLFTVSVSSILALAFPHLHASSHVPLDLEEESRRSHGIFRGRVLGFDTFQRDGLIHTATFFSVDQALKGRFATTVRLVHRGGRLGEIEQDNGLAPEFSLGEEYLVHVRKNQEGLLETFAGRTSARRMKQISKGQLERVRKSSSAPEAGPSLDATDQTAPSASQMVAPQNAGIAATTQGLIGATPARFIAPDGDEPIPYLIDAGVLPAGVTHEQALEAVQNALAAWRDVTSLNFVFEGFANFGAGADTLPTPDGRIRIQLHDSYSRIADGSNILGIGGRASSSGGYAGGAGGNVDGVEFHRTTYGYVVLEHGASALQNLQTLEEVLCHELGHVLGLVHSSEDPNEPDAVLRGATMYYRIHGNGRGATLGLYDPPTVQQAHPFDTPPVGFARVLDAMTTAGVPATAGVNEIDVRGYDRNSAAGSLLPSIIGTNLNNGTFTLNGSKLRYWPSAFYSQSSRLDPAGNQYFDRATLRLSDGLNHSPFFTVRVISLNPDSSPSGGDGMPDNWMNTYFGTSNPGANPRYGSSADFDDDGRTNLEEYRARTSPSDPASVFQVSQLTASTMQWPSAPYELYQLHRSTDGTSWIPFGPPRLLTGTAGSAPLTPAAAGAMSYKVERVQ